MASFYLCPIANFVQLLQDSGQVLTNGLIYTYAAGSSTPTSTWTDITGGTPNANPIQLNSAGRLPNAVWQQGGVPIKVQFCTNAGTSGAPVFGVQIGPTWDQVSGVDDPASLLTILANPASGSGADLVANAMRSYDLIATVRAANVPSLSAGQTLIIDVQGGMTINDGAGGLFFWSASSTAADDAGVTTIKPTAAGSTGRYIRQNPFGAAGSVTITLSGVSGTVTTVAQYYYIGQIVTFRIPQVNGTSNSTSFGFGFSVSSLPVSIAPFQAQNIAVSACEDNGAAVYNNVIAQVPPASLGNVTVTLLKGGSATGWTNTGTKGISDGSGANYSVTLTWVLN